MAGVRRIEGAAEQADPHAGRVRGQDALGACELLRLRAVTAGSARVPRTRYLNVVSCSTPTGPRACSGRWRCRSRRRSRIRRRRRTASRRCAARWRNRPRCRNFSAAAWSRGDDGVGVVRAVALDMLDRRVDAVDHAGGDDGVEIFGATSPPRVAGFTRASAALHGGVAAHFAAGVEQHGDQRLEMRRRHGAIDQQRLGRAADAGAPHLGVEHDGLGHVERGGLVDIDMADAFEMREHRHARFGLHARDQALAAARHDDVDGAVETVQHHRRRRRGRAVGTSWIAASGRSAARRPSTSAAWMARTSDG